MATARGSLTISDPEIGNVSDKAVFPPRGKYKGELWTKKFKHMDESWTTCNKEYGDFVPKGTVLKMDGSQESMDDGGPWMASSYQMGYNIRPQMRKKWLNSWRGFVKRKVDLSHDEMKDLISPNTYKGKAPPMERGEGWVDDGPWGSSTYQMGYNMAPEERDPKPIYRFTRDSPTNAPSPDKMVKGLENNPYKSIRKQQIGSPKKAHPGVKLPPISDVPEKARQDIQIHKGEIYMSKPKEKKLGGVNESFFNFTYKPYWKPLNVYKSARTLIHVCWAESCDIAAIKQCLRPSISFLQDHNMGQSTKGLFLTTLEHYMMTLQDVHEDFIHISSLNTILTSIDKALMRPIHLRDACGVFERTERCLQDTKVWCDGEMRDQLEGIEDMFNYMCRDDKIKVYRANYLCLSQNNTLKSVRKSCNNQLELGLLRVGQPSTVTRSPVSPMDLEEDRDAVLYTTGLHISRKEMSHDNIQHLSRTVCGLVSTALNCYHSSVEMNCPGGAAEWTTRLRHTLVHLLLVDLQCEDYDSGYRFKDLYREPVCFQCTGNQSDCIDLSLKCNSVEDCQDGSDEHEDICDKQTGVNVAGILIGLSVVAVVIIIVIVCVVKRQRSTDFDNKLATGKFSTEMLSIADEEVVLSETTPPAPSGGNKFIYQAVKNGNAANA